MCAGAAAFVLLVYLGSLRWEFLIRYFRTQWGMAPLEADAWVVRCRKALHVPLYVAVTWCAARWVARRRPRGNSHARGPWLPVACLAFLVAVADEGVQALMPGRTGRWSDLGLDALGITIGLLLFARGGRSRA